MLHIPCFCNLGLWQSTGQGTRPRCGLLPRAKFDKDWKKLNKFVFKQNLRKVQAEGPGKVWRWVGRSGINRRVGIRATLPPATSPILPHHHQSLNLQRWFSTGVHIFTRIADCWLGSVFITTYWSQKGAIPSKTRTSYVHLGWAYLSAFLSCNTSTVN